MPETKDVVCIYTLRGHELKRKTQPHPGMDSHELDGYIHDRRDEKMTFSWDHMTTKGEHVFVGTATKVPTSMPDLSTPTEKKV